MLRVSSCLFHPISRRCFAGEQHGLRFALVECTLADYLIAPAALPISLYEGINELCSRRLALQEVLVDRFEA